MYVVAERLPCCCCMLHCMHTVACVLLPCTHRVLLGPIICCLYHQGGITHAVCRALLHGQQAASALQELRCGVSCSCPAL